MAKASFWTQADALLRKNLTYQKRNKRTNAFLIAFPVVLCIVLSLLQKWVDNEYDQAEFKCGCNPMKKTECGIQYSDPHQSSYCQITRPSKWPTLIQIPDPRYRAVRGPGGLSDLPDGSCRNEDGRGGACPVNILTTGKNYSLAQSLGMNMLTTSPLNRSNILDSLSTNVFGSSSLAPSAMYIDSAFNSGGPLYYLQPQQCSSNSTSQLSYSAYNVTFKLELRCAQGQLLWRNTSSEINKELYQGYHKGNSYTNINEFLAEYMHSYVLFCGYDFLNSNDSNFNVSIWYNATYGNDSGFNRYTLIAMARVPRSVNLVSNAYLQYRKGLGTKILFEFVKDMPKQETDLKIDIASQVGAQLYTYVMIALFPSGYAMFDAITSWVIGNNLSVLKNTGVVLTFLVYENQNRLRIMMKMHGLGDGPYWLITYFYFLAMSVAYILFFMIFGSLIGLKIFTTNDCSIQFVFYFVYINLQILMAFLLAPLFTDVLTAQVAGNIMIFGSGLLGAFLFSSFVEDTTFPRRWVIMMELYPGFSLYRGLYELGEYSSVAYRVGASGMKWKNLGDSSNGMKEVLIIMSVEWLILLPIAYLVDRSASSSGLRMSFERFIAYFFPPTSFLFRKNLSKVNPEVEKPDVFQEKKKVEQMMKEGSLDKNVICKDLRKVYAGRDGNSSKVAVKGLSLSLSHGECFGMLGPNGAGKTSFISMMIGLSKPSSGSAFVDGKSISTQMDEIYTSMGVCPQHDLLWETLTGREHLLFYGRLKNLKGEALNKAVEESLKSVALFHGGVGDKVAGKYSGGMKRRLSVAISLIGDPKVVYMDEPSTGLDPASRNSLWNVVKQAKQDRAIILTTHSMEEAEVLCDRLGIFVDGNLQCIGNPKELKARYGGSYVLTMTTSNTHEVEVERMVQGLSSSAQRIYHISGTQKFELPKEQVKISDVFRAVQRAKRSFTVYAWGLSDATLEDVFVIVSRQAQPFGLISY